tara:strand:- start:201 stop:377 length:177 start_codon:yes stop_codon:yes gene_type:complete
MAKIDPPVLPQATEEYDQSQLNQLVEAMDQTIKMLNTSYTPEQLREEAERLSWYVWAK